MLRRACRSLCRLCRAGTAIGMPARQACPCPKPTKSCHPVFPQLPPPLQHKFKGEEVDFVESYFFPLAPEFERQLAAKRQARQAQRAQQAAAAVAEE